MKLSSFKQMDIRLERSVAPFSLTDLNRICEDLDAEADWIPFGQQAPATDDQLKRLVRQCDSRTLSIMLDACERLAQIENEE